MGLREDIQADMAEAFDTDLADAVKTFTGGITLPGTYDPVTEETVGEVVIAYGGRGVFDSYEDRLVDGINIKSTDQVLIALTNEVTGTPEIGHKINGAEVLNVSKDPAEAHYEIQLRAM